METILVVVIFFAIALMGWNYKLLSRWDKLHKAVKNLYYAAFWISDRPIDQNGYPLWEAVRDAAGFKTGDSPDRIYGPMQEKIYMEAHDDALDIAERIVKKHNVFHGDQHGGYAAPSVDAEELATAIRRAKGQTKKFLTNEKK